MGVATNTAVNYIEGMRSFVSGVMGSGSYRKARAISRSMLKGATSSRALTQAAMLGMAGGATGFGYSQATGDGRTDRDIAYGAVAGVLGGMGYGASRSRAMTSMAGRMRRGYAGAVSTAKYERGLGAINKMNRSGMSSWTPGAQGPFSSWVAGARGPASSMSSPIRPRNIRTALGM